MKKILSSAIIMASLVIATSCNEKAKLAQAVNGQWSGAPERVADPSSPTTVTVTRNMTFLPDLNSSTSGTVDATAIFEVESGTKLQAAGIQPIAITVNGNASISGNWEAVDDDEILVSFDYSTLNVDIDPEAIELQYDIMTQTSQAINDSIKPAMAQQVKKLMTGEMQHEVFNYGKIDDIKINGRIMSCEIGKKDYTFRREM